jgi:hypothetical protein
MKIKLSRKLRIVLTCLPITALAITALAAYCAHEVKVVIERSMESMCCRPASDNDPVTGRQRD